MNPDTVSRLDALFASLPLLKAGGPVTDEEIDSAEHRVGIPFDADYRSFIKRYGGAMVGSLPVFGLRTSEVMGVGDTVDQVTLQFRSQGYEHANEWIVVSGDGYGNPIGMDRQGRLYLSDHERDIVMVAPSFDEFVRKLLDGSVF
jgi:hypothetical protein